MATSVSSLEIHRAIVIEMPCPRALVNRSCWRGEKIAEVHGPSRLVSKEGVANFCAAAIGIYPTPCSACSMMKQYSADDVCPNRHRDVPLDDHLVINDVNSLPAVASKLRTPSATIGFDGDAHRGQFTWRHCDGQCTGWVTGRK